MLFRLVALDLQPFSYSKGIVSGKEKMDSAADEASSLMQFTKGRYLRSED
jgi:hypothetical protein